MQWLKSALGWLPAKHATHSPPSLLNCPLPHITHAVRSPFGIEPDGHISHAPPYAEKTPQPPIRHLAKALSPYTTSVPAAHGTHDTPSRLCRS
eukprot:COSAG05_NODE_14858_length_385_cov_0.629371_1_plen_92_part_10